MARPVTLWVRYKQKSLVELIKQEEEEEEEEEEGGFNGVRLMGLAAPSCWSEAGVEKDWSRPNESCDGSQNKWQRLLQANDHKIQPHSPR